MGGLDLSSMGIDPASFGIGPASDDESDGSSEIEG